MKDVAFMLSQLLLVNRLFELMTRRKLRILCYHGLWVSQSPPFGNKVFMPIEQFRDRMISLKKSNFNIITLDDALTGLLTGSLPDRAVVVTIDDGWASSYTHMLPILEDLRIPATLYVSTWYVGKKFPVINKAIEYICAVRNIDSVVCLNECNRIESLAEDARGEALLKFSFDNNLDSEWWDCRQFHFMTAEETKDAKIRGLDIQLHSHRHKNFAIHKSDLASEIQENRKALSIICGLGEDQFRHFCYPSGYFDDHDLTELESSFVKTATLVNEGMNSVGCNVFRLRRFLDGRLITKHEFNAYLSGSRDAFQFASRKVKGIADNLLFI